MRIYFELREQMPPNVSKRADDKASRVGMFAVGQVYESEIKQEKFRSDAERVFGFQKRKESYTQQQEKIGQKSFRVKLVGGKKVPLLKSGRTRTALLAPHVIRPTANRVRINLNLPGYVRLRPNKPGHPNMGQEVTSITTRHLERMKRFYLAAKRQEFERLKQFTRSRIG